MKECIKCRKHFDVALFSKDRTRKDGLSARCKYCDQLKSITKDRNPEKYRLQRIKKCEKHLLYWQNEMAKLKLHSILTMENI